MPVQPPPPPLPAPSPLPLPAQPPQAVVIGGGPAGLMAAETLAAAGATVEVLDHMPSVGRKLLIAGRGGLNLTHSEPLDAFLDRYGPARAALEPALRAFPPAALIEWCHGLGQETFVGSSGRVFPRSLKASPLLRAWLGRLAGLGVVIRPRHRWTGFDAAGGLTFATPAGEVRLQPGATVLALGGGSWAKLGSDGAWTGLLGDLAVAPLRPANCGFQVGWTETFRQRFAGQPLKRIALEFRGTRLRGEAMLTAAGIEGGAVYALSAALRDAIAAEGPVTLAIDLRPDLAPAELQRRLDGPRRGRSLANLLRGAGLSPVAIGLVQEALHGPEAAAAATRPLSALVRALPLRLTAPMPLARAISSAGGLALA